MINGDAMDVCMLVANDARRDPRVQKEAKSLAEAGWSVAVIAVTNRDEDVGWEEAEGGYRVRRIRTEPSIARAVKRRLSSISPRALEVVTRELRRLRGIPERPIAAAGEKLTPEEEQRAQAAQMIAAVRTHHTSSRVMAQAAIATMPRVVHAHDLDTLLAGAWAARAVGAALVFDSHELFWAAHPDGFAPKEWIDFFRELEERLIPSVDAVITVCDSIADHLTALHGIEKPLVVRNSIELVSPISPPCARDPNEPIEVLFHGGFQPARGLEELIEAARSFRGARLVLRGFGSLEPKLRDKVERDGLGSIVRFEDPVPMQDVVRSASSADVGVIPYQPLSLNNRYSTPNKLFEYLNAGLAIAASDLPEIARIVESEGVGVLFEPTDPRSIAAAIDELASDRDRLFEMRRRAREAAELRHHWGVDETRLLQLYRGLLPRPPIARVKKILRGR